MRQSRIMYTNEYKVHEQYIGDYEYKPHSNFHRCIPCVLCIITEFYHYGGMCYGYGNYWWSTEAVYVGRSYSSHKVKLILIIMTGPRECYGFSRACFLKINY